MEQAKIIFDSSVEAKLEAKLAEQLVPSDKNDPSSKLDAIQRNEPTKLNHLVAESVPIA